MYCFNPREAGLCWRRIKISNYSKDYMMNSKRGFKRVTFTLAAVAALASGIFAGMIPCSEYQTARSFWGLTDPNWPVIVKEPEVLNR